MKNGDNQCFLWCVLRALNPKDKDQERVDTKLSKKENTLNKKGKEYPVNLKDFNKFEKQNPTISITVLGYERKSVHPLRSSDFVDRENKIIPLLTEENGVTSLFSKKSKSSASLSGAKIKRKTLFLLKIFESFVVSRTLE